MNYEQLEGDGAAAQAEAEHQNWLAEEQARNSRMDVIGQNGNEGLHYDNEKLHVSYFSAVWCGPCKMFKPAFEEVTKEFGDSIEVSYYDVDQHREVAAAKMISAVPTVIMTKGTEDVFRNSGVMSKAALKEQIEKHK